MSHKARFPFWSVLCVIVSIAVILLMAPRAWRSLRLQANYAALSYVTATSEAASSEDAEPETPSLIADLDATGIDASAVGAPPATPPHAFVQNGDGLVVYPPVAPAKPAPRQYVRRSSLRYARIGDTIDTSLFRRPGDPPLADASDKPQIELAAPGKPVDPVSQFQSYTPPAIDAAIVDVKSNLAALPDYANAAPYDSSPLATLARRSANGNGGAFDPSARNIGPEWPRITEQANAAPSESIARVATTVTPGFASQRVVTPRTVVQPAHASVGVWPYPATLGSIAKELEAHAFTADWARKLQAEIRTLGQIDAFSSTDSALCINRFDTLADEAWTLSQATDEQPMTVALQRASFAIARRVEVWQHVHAVASSTQPVKITAKVDREDLQQQVAAVEAQLQRLTHGESWRKYLLLDQVKEVAAGRGGLSPAVVSRTVITRLHTARSKENRKAFFSQPEFIALGKELSHWVVEPVDFASLLWNLEHYEECEGCKTAADVAAGIHDLRWAQSHYASQLGQRLETSYRNANARLSVSGEFLNQLLPQPEAQSQRVAEHLLGANVYGRSRADTNLALVLKPDPNRIKVELQAAGAVTSRTSAHRSPVTFHNRGAAEYQGRKLLAVDCTGVRSWDAEVQATSRNCTVGVDSDFDHIPLLGPLVRHIADQQRADQQGRANRIVEVRLSDRVASQLDESVGSKLQEAEQTFQLKVLTPLNQLNLDPKPVDMQTTSSHISVRYRLAGKQQLAAHTPRPRAPANHVFAVQLHQTVLNNAIEQLQLSGRETGLQELHDELVSKFDVMKGASDPLPEDVVIKFASEDPIAIAFKDDRVVFTLRIDYIDNGRRRLNDFAVRVAYKPVVNGLDVKLMRDGFVELVGRRVGFRDQIVIRGLFSAVFSKERPVQITPQTVLENPHIRNVAVTQMVIDEGWIGLAADYQAKPAVTPQQFAPAGTGWRPRTIATQPDGPILR